MAESDWPLAGIGVECAECMSAPAHGKEPHRPEHPNMMNLPASNVLLVEDDPKMHEVLAAAA